MWWEEAGEEAHGDRALPPLSSDSVLAQACTSHYKANKSIHPGRGWAPLRGLLQALLGADGDSQGGILEKAICSSSGVVVLPPQLGQHLFLQVAGIHRTLLPSPPSPRRSPWPCSPSTAALSSITHSWPLLIISLFACSGLSLTK